MAYSYFTTTDPRKQVYPVLQRFFRVYVVDGVLSALRSLTEDGDAREAAIRALQDSDADPDTQEWAERHLCGMAGPDATAFMTDRRAQS